MSSEKTYIVAYDICDPRRLRRVFRVMRDFGNRLQLSVFRCELEQHELDEMRRRLEAEINHCEDQVVVIPLGQPDGANAQGIWTIGLRYVPPEKGAKIV